MNLGNVKGLLAWGTLRIPRVVFWLTLFVIGLAHEPVTRVIDPGRFPVDAGCSARQPLMHSGLASAVVFSRTPTRNPRPWGGLFRMLERCPLSLTDGLQVG